MIRYIFSEEIDNGYTFLPKSNGNLLGLQRIAGVDMNVLVS
jgi:hypothetical protein